MHKRMRSFSIMALLAVVVFSSCSKTNKQGRYIPKNAGIVMHIDGASLNSKLPWEEIKKNEGFQKMIADSNISAFSKSILDNPENSGVNTKTDIIAFVVKDSVGGYVAFEGSITDEAKFKKMLTEAAKDAKESTKDGFTFSSTDKGVIAYNKEKFIATINTPEISAMDGYKEKPTDSLGNPLPSTTPTRDMAAATTALINLKEDNSLAVDEKFTELVKTTGDIHFWLNAEHFNSAGALGAAATMINLTKLYKGAITAATLNFDNGKIVIDSKSYGGKELTDLYKKYSGSGIDKKMITSIPSQNVAGLFALNFKPEGVKEFLKLLNLDGFLNIGLAQAGLNLDDFIKANKGDILFAVTDLKQDTIGRPDAQVLFAASIGDKASFKKLIDAGNKLGGSMLSSGENEKIVFNTNDNYFAISNSKTTTDSYLAGKASSNFSFFDKISEGPIAGYVNIQYILTSMKPSATSDSLTKVTYDENVKMWDNVIISGGNFKSGGLTQHIEINLLDKNTNSLKQLNGYASKMYVIEEKKKAQYATMWNDNDVIMDAPATDTTVTTIK